MAEKNKVEAEEPSILVEMIEEKALGSTHPAISVKQITKRFGQTIAVNDVTFEVQRGEVVGFLGPQRLRKDHHHEAADLILHTGYRQHPHRRRRQSRTRRGNPGKDRLLAREQPHLRRLARKRVAELRCRAAGAIRGRAPRQYRRGGGRGRD